MMKQSIPELLAPAGSPAALTAAVEGGADAVYMGCSEFANARMNAQNFTKQTLAEGIDFCHSRDVKAYITVNTLLSDREMEGLYAYASFLYQKGADGLIVQDAGALEFLHRTLPELPLHASTQMGIVNTAGIRAAQKLGCCRAVAARELSMEDLALLCAGPLEVEVFVHGALCACYSGFCLMSSLIGRRSGNRGKCAQPCRLPYSIDQKAPAYLMSLKDLMLLPHLEQLKHIGVASLKIEGRMKGPDYVGLVTAIYRRALDGEPITPAMITQLQAAFDRGGYTDGYFTGHGKMFAYTKPATPYGSQPKAQSVSRKIPITMEGNLEMGQVFSLSVTDSRGNCAVGKGETPAFLAQNRPLEEDTVVQRLCKLGDTPYQAAQCRLSLQPGLMVPLGEIARAKRQACDGLTALRIKAHHRPAPQKPAALPPSERISCSEMEWTATADTIEQYRAIKDLPLAWIGLPEDVVWKNREELDPQRIVLRLPSVTEEARRPQQIQHLAHLRSMGFSTLLCGNVGDFYDFPDWEKKGGLTLWVYNSASAAVFAREHPSSLCLSPEMNLGQIRKLRSPVPCEALVYGRLPLMVTKHCFVQSARGSCKGSCSVTDRTGTQFPVRCVGGRHILYNSAPLYMGDRLDEFRSTCAGFARISFTTETPKECLSVFRSLQSAALLEGTITRGHYYRGV
ncbi:MAG: DUF3656 domain-containing protein [Clostridia bacterium]|nr:DUF3656 domain-containing protein [Clostridia bacterium]